MANSNGQQLVDQARSRSGYQNTAFVTDPEVLGWVNDRRIELRDLIIEQDEGYYAKPYGFSLPDTVLAAAYTVSGLGTPPPNFAALPVDFDRAAGVDLGGGTFNQDGGGPSGTRPQTVHEFGFAQRNDLRGPRYKIFGYIADTQILMVMPEENSAGSWRLWYIPQVVPLTLVTTLDVMEQRFSRYISLGAGINILEKAKRDTSMLEKNLAKVMTAIQTMSNNRDSEAEQGGSDGQGDAMRRWPYYWGR